MEIGVEDAMKFSRNIDDLIKKVNEVEKKNESLQRENEKLKKKLEKKKGEYKRLIEITNIWRLDYQELDAKYNNLEAKYDAFAVGVGLLAPKFKEKLEEDTDKEIFSDVISWCKRNRW